VGGGGVVADQGVDWKKTGLGGRRKGIKTESAVEDPGHRLLGKVKGGKKK